MTLQSLNTPVGVEVLLTVRDESLEWETSSKTHTDRTDPLGDLSKWFSFTIEEEGTIANVFLPSNEKRGIAAFKKSLAQLLVLSGEGEVERVATTSGGLKVTETSSGEKQTNKVYQNSPTRKIVRDVGTGMCLTVDTIIVALSFHKSHKYRQLSITGVKL